MITTGEIKSINFDSNSCTLHLALFDTALHNEETIAEAKFAIQPGSCNCYKVGDMVWVAFNLDKAHMPIIIGKVFESAIDEAKSARGSLNVESLVCTDSMKIPADAEIWSNGKQVSSLNNIINNQTAIIKSLNGDISAELLTARHGLLITFYTQDGANVFCKISAQTAKAYTDFSTLLQNIKDVCSTAEKGYLVHAIPPAQDINTSNNLLPGLIYVYEYEGTTSLRWVDYTSNSGYIELYNQDTFNKEPDISCYELTRI